MDLAVYVTSILMWILCPAVIGLILLQGAAGDISSSFGGGGQLDASLGVGAHRKMAQITGVLAVLFFVMVLLMAYPHRGSFRDVKGSTVPVAPVAPKTQSVPALIAKPVEATPAPLVQPEATQPVVVAPAPVVQPEAAKPVEAAPTPAPVVPPAAADPAPSKP
jgi:protein translocase SecG subunit